MKDLTLADLSGPIRDFLASVERDRGALIRDDAGRLVLSIVPCDEASRMERERARQDLRRIQAKVGARLRSLGVTEEEFDRAVQED